MDPGGTFPDRELKGTDEPVVAGAGNGPQDDVNAT